MSSFYTFRSLYKYVYLEIFLNFDAITREELLYLSFSCSTNLFFWVFVKFFKEIKFNDVFVALQ